MANSVLCIIAKTATSQVIIATIATLTPDESMAGLYKLYSTPFNSVLLNLSDYDPFGSNNPSTEVARKSDI